MFNDCEQTFRLRNSWSRNSFNNENDKTLSINEPYSGWKRELRKPTEAKTVKSYGRGTYASFFNKRKTDSLLHGK